MLTFIFHFIFTLQCHFAMSGQKCPRTRNMIAYKPVMLCICQVNKLLKFKYPNHVLIKSNKKLFGSSRTCSSRGTTTQYMFIPPVGVPRSLSHEQWTNVWTGVRIVIAHVAESPRKDPRWPFVQWLDSSHIHRLSKYQIHGFHKLHRKTNGMFVYQHFQIALCKMTSHNQEGTY